MMPMPSLLAEPSRPIANKPFVGGGNGDTLRVRAGMMKVGVRGKPCDTLNDHRIPRSWDPAAVRGAHLKVKSNRSNREWVRNQIVD